MGTIVSMYDMIIGINRIIASPWIWEPSGFAHARRKLTTDWFGRTWASRVEEELTPVVFKLHFGMTEVKLTPQFLKWFDGLRDYKARGRIRVRLDRLALGLIGDAKPVREGLSELRIDYGPGYRVYFIQKGDLLVIVLGGGTKRTQDRDIEAALEIVRRQQV